MKKRILIPTAGIAAATETAEYIIQIAQAIEAKLYVLHVVRPGKSHEAAELCIEVFRETAKELDIEVEGIIVEGSIASQIVDFAEENNIDLIVMGASNGIVVDNWMSYDVCGMTAIPVLVIPYQIIGASA